MEKSFIINNIVEKEVYHIEKCVQTDAQSCSLFLSNQKGKFIRKNLPFSQVSLLLKKNSWIFALIFGDKYRSEYTADVLPYYDNGWKYFIWRDLLDGKEFSCNNSFPAPLADFLNGFDNLYTRFINTLEDCLQKRKYLISDKMRLSSLMDIYWVEFLCRYSKKKEILNYLYPMLVLISRDKKKLEVNEANKPLSIEKYLCRTQHISDIDFDYENLADTYLDNIYDFLQFCYQTDLCTLSDIYGGEQNIGKNTSILDYEGYLHLFDAIDLVIKHLTFK